mmetsp:Transcript_39942/g.119547  ORF Transcript_39942/g.119547 Transcript_39942/m.119547 type:complete len:243 (-) Transcript_39942:936-1664(-)
MLVDLALADPRLALELVLSRGPRLLLQRRTVLHVRLAKRQSQDLELLAQALAQELQVQHAHASEQGLSGAGDGLNTQAGIVLADRLQCPEQPLLLAAIEAVQLQDKGAAPLPRVVRSRLTFSGLFQRRVRERCIRQKELGMTLWHALGVRRHEDQVSGPSSQDALQLATGPMHVELLGRERLTGHLRLVTRNLQRPARAQEASQNADVQQAAAGLLAAAEDPAQERLGLHVSLLGRGSDRAS